MASRVSTFLAEMKRRKVYHVGIAYVVVGAILGGAANDFLPGLGAPGWTVAFIIVLILIGFPIALVLAWAYELKPEESRPAKISGQEPPQVPEEKAPTEMTAAQQRKSIVVLPFDNHSPDPGDAYFADGLTEEIITELSFLRTLRVISRNTAMVLKGTQKDVCTIGRELNVEYVLEGSVRKAGSDLRITAQLIDARTDTHLWAEKHDGVLDEVFAIQERVARSVVEALSLRITPKESERIAERPINDVQAYQAYLRARHELAKFTREGLDRALREANAGLGLLGENIHLLFILGYSYWSFLNQGHSSDYSYLGKAEEIVQRIFTLDPESAHGHNLQGLIHYKRGLMREAIHHVEVARERDPTLEDTAFLLNYWYGDVGRVEDMPPMAAQATQEDPLIPLAWWAAGWCELMSGRFTPAVVAFERMHAMAPENPLSQLSLGHALAHNGKQSEARELLLPLAAEAGTNPLGWVAAVLASSLEESESAIPSPIEEIRARAWTDEYLSWMVAEGFARSGHSAEALEWLRHAMERGFVNHPFIADHDRFFDPIRSEPGFHRLLDEMEDLWLTHQPARP